MSDTSYSKPDIWQASPKALVDVVYYAQRCLAMLIGTRSSKHSGA